MRAERERDAILDCAGMVTALLRGDAEMAEAALRLGEPDEMCWQLARWRGFAISCLPDELQGEAVDAYRAMAADHWGDYRHDGSP